MKSWCVVLIYFLVSCASPKTNESATALSYDSLLAAKAGADNYGMKQYVMVFLKAGSNRNQDSSTAAQLQAAHMANISRMAEEGKLVLAGPFLDDQDIKGIYIFDVANLEEAQQLTDSDPAVQAGRLIMELHLWYGSAGLTELNNIHKKLAKENF